MESLRRAFALVVCCGVATILSALDATVLSTNTSQMWAAITAGAVAVCFSVVGCVVLHFYASCRASTFITPSVLCLSVLAHVVSTASFNIPVKPWVVLLCCAAALLLPLMEPLPSMSFVATTAVVFTILAAYILSIGSLHESSVIATLVILELLLASPAPYILHDHLNMQHSMTLTSIERESEAQEILLHRVIPSVFVDAMLNNRKTTSPPLPDISVIFVEVMVRAAGSAPRKLGSNIQGDTLIILSHVFKLLDRVVSRNGVFKVETIGSEFMAVAGLPSQLKHHKNTAYAAVVTALDMQHAVLADSRHGILRDLTGGRFTVSLQIGINSGWVVEAILGKRLLPRYKLFGDAVNTASRMKSNGLFGRINVSRATRNLLMRDAAQIILAARTPVTPTDGASPCNVRWWTECTGVEADAISVTSPRGEVVDASAAEEAIVLTASDDVPVQICDTDVAFGQVAGFILRPRPVRQVKGKGHMCMYLVEMCSVKTESNLPPITRTSHESQAMASETPLQLDTPLQDLSDASLRWLTEHDAAYAGACEQEALLLRFTTRNPTRWTGKYVHGLFARTLSSDSKALSSISKAVKVPDASILQPSEGAGVLPSGLIETVHPPRTGSPSAPLSADTITTQSVRLAGMTSLDGSGLSLGWSVQINAGQGSPAGCDGAPGDLEPPLRAPLGSLRPISSSYTGLRIVIGHDHADECNVPSEGDKETSVKIEESGLPTPLQKRFTTRRQAVSSLCADDLQKDLERAEKWRLTMHRHNKARANAASTRSVVRGASIRNRLPDDLGQSDDGNAFSKDDVDVHLPGAMTSKRKISLTSRHIVKLPPLDVVSRGRHGLQSGSPSFHSTAAPASTPEQPIGVIDEGYDFLSPASPVSPVNDDIEPPTIVSAGGVVAGRVTSPDLDTRAPCNTAGTTDMEAVGPAVQTAEQIPSPTRRSLDISLDPWFLTFAGKQSSLNVPFAANSTIKVSFATVAAVSWELVVLAFVAWFVGVSAPTVDPIFTSAQAVLLPLYAALSATAIIVSLFPRRTSYSILHLRLQWCTYCSLLGLKVGSGVAILAIVTWIASFSTTPLSQWTTLFICSNTFSLLSSSSLCYGLLFQHYIFVSVFGFGIITAALSAAQPTEWIVGVFWLAVALTVDGVLVRRRERRMREAFISLHVMRAQQGKTQEMLYAMLPPKIADQMATREQLRSLTLSSPQPKRSQLSSPPSSGKAFFDESDSSGAAAHGILEPELYVDATSGQTEGGSPRRRGDPLLLGAGGDAFALSENRPALPETPSDGVDGTACDAARTSRQTRSLESVARTLRTRLLGQWGGLPSEESLQTRVASALRARGNDTDVEDIGVLGDQLSREYRRANTYSAALLMFDLVSFTVMSQDLGPQAVLDLLERLYASFDRILQRRGALKIETIGDAMFVACGVPDALPLQKSVRTIAKVALDMVAVVNTLDTALSGKLKGHKLYARIGIHCGEVLAGVIGEDMPRFQLFGPAVDEAQTMESSGEAGCVHASAAVVRVLESSRVGEVRGVAACAGSDLKIVRRKDDGTAFVQRDRVEGARSGIPW